MEARVKLYNMTMVYDGHGRALVLDRTKSDWPGLTFPGGHVEPGEGIVASAVREIREETGLSVRNLEPCGVVHWAEKNADRRCLEFLYRTSDFSGIPSDGTREGKIFWMEMEALRASDRLSPNFERYLPLFREHGFSELFFEWDGISCDGVPQYFRYRFGE